MSEVETAERFVLNAGTGRWVPSNPNVVADGRDTNRLQPPEAAAERGAFALSPARGLAPGDRASQQSAACGFRSLDGDARTSSDAVHLWCWDALRAEQGSGHKGDHGRTVGDDENCNDAGGGSQHRWDRSGR